jgi:hypothetical protein
MFILNEHHVMMYWGTGGTCLYNLHLGTRWKEPLVPIG